MQMDGNDYHVKAPNIPCVLIVKAIKPPKRCHSWNNQTLEMRQDNVCTEGGSFPPPLLFLIGKSQQTFSVLPLTLLSLSFSLCFPSPSVYTLVNPRLFPPSLHQALTQYSSLCVCKWGDCGRCGWCMLPVEFLLAPVSCPLDFMRWKSVQACSHMHTLYCTHKCGDTQQIVERLSSLP